MPAGLTPGLGRNRHPTGSGNRLEPGGDIHVIAEQIVLVGHHVAHVDAETELHDTVCGKLVVPFRHQALHLDRRLDRADDAREFQQETITGVLHDVAAMIENDRIHRASMSLERGVRPCLVGAHQPRVAGNVGANHGSQTFSPSPKSS